MNTSPHDSRPYVTIVAWPPGFDRESTVRLLATVAGLDEPTLRLRAASEPPVILGLLEPPAARDAVARIVNAGGDAFACTLDDLARLGGTLKIKDLRLVDGALEVDLWRGLTTTLRRDQVQILVRAHLRREIQARTAPVRMPTGGLGALPSLDATGMTVGLGGASGAALGFESAYLARDMAAEKRQLATSDKLDIHTTDGSVYQIDGDKFGYRALGELRGHSDKVNMDRMCELLSHLAPDEIVDPFFSLWRPPPGYQRLRLPDAKLNRDDPAFAFYSRWVALMYRHVMGWSLS